jgi:hypothetical protein
MDPDYCVDLMARLKQGNAAIRAMSLDDLSASLQGAFDAPGYETVAMIVGELVRRLRDAEERMAERRAMRPD